MGTFSIRVVDEKGKPRRSIKVSVAYLSFGGVGSEYTDNDGWTKWETLDYVSFRVYINGRDEGRFGFEDRETRSFTLAK
jgi:hypothetical protein